MPSLESKINNFLQVNPGFAGVFEAESNSPLIVGGDSTPVRDERGGTPTQDEIVDSPRAMGHKAHISSWGGEDDHKDRDYRTPSGKSKNKEHAVLKRRNDASPGHTSSASFSLQEVTMKAKTEGRRATGGTPREKGKEERGGKKAAKKQQATAEDIERYHRIETVVSAATGDEATTIDPHGYSNRIQTVESIRVIGRGPRRSSGSTRGAGVWYEEAEFMEAAPLPHPGNHGLENSGDLTSAQGHLVVPQGQYSSPPPPPFFPPCQSPAPLMVPPPHITPPIPPPLTSNRDFPHSATTTSVMVGGILVPIDRVLPLPPANLRPEAVAAHGGGAISNNSRAKSHSMRPLHRPLLGQRPAPPSPTTPTTPPINSREPRPLLPSPPRPLLCLPSQRLPLPREPLLPGAKRNAPTYRGGSVHRPKRPFLPPRY